MHIAVSQLQMGHQGGRIEDEPAGAGEDEKGSLGITAVGDHHATQPVLVVAVVHQDRPLADAPELPGLQDAATGCHVLEQRSKCAAPGGLHVREQPDGDARDRHGQCQHRQEKCAQPEAAGLHGSDLGVGREPPHGEQHAEQER